MSTSFIDARGIAVFDGGNWGYERDERNITVLFYGRPGWTDPQFHRAVIDDFGNLVKVGGPL